MLVINIGAAPGRARGVRQAARTTENENRHSAFSMRRLFLATQRIWQRLRTGRECMGLSCLHNSMIHAITGTGFYLPPSNKVQSSLLLDRTNYILSISGMRALRRGIPLTPAYPGPTHALRSANALELRAYR
jgi:hypothetical protein